MPTNQQYLTNSAELSSVADAIREKGGASALLEYPDGFVDAIEEISTTPELQSKTVTPARLSQTVVPDSGYYGLSSVLVNGDNNLVAENIKKDVTIFNTTGTFEGNGDNELKIFYMSGVMLHATGYTDPFTQLVPFTYFSGPSLVENANVEILTSGDYILLTITGRESRNTIPFTTIQRGRYSFTMPGESVEIELYYDD